MLVIHVESHARRDQEEGSELDSHEEVRLSFAGPAEIRGRSGCWALKRAQGRSRAGRWSWAQKVGLVFCFNCSPTAVLRTLYLWLLRTAVETAIAEHTSCFAMARSPLPIINKLLFWRWSTASSVFWGSDCADEPLTLSLSPPPPHFPRP